MGRGLSRQPQPSCAGTADFPSIILATLNPALEKATAETMVYVTKSGTKYHRAGCRALAKSSTPIPLGQVAGRYEACAVCDPPKLP
jgi:hypothetical protein